MASSDSTGRTLRKRGDSMKLKLLAILLALILACSQAPTEPQEPEPPIDSLLGVIDTLRIQLGRNTCLVHCLQATLDSLNAEIHCECGI